MQSKMAKEKRLVLIIKFVVRGKKAQLTSQFTDSTPYNKKNLVSLYRHLDDHVSHY